MIRAACLFLVLSVVPAGAVVVPDGFVDTQVAGGFQLISNFDFLPDGRVLVVERSTAQIRLVENGGISFTDPVGVVPDVQSGLLDNGLLGIAVDPRWPAKPYIYVFYSALSGPNLKLTRFALTGDLSGGGGSGLSLDLSSKRDILADLPDDSEFHNGGTVLFGRDSLLYVSVGDDMVPCSSQDLHQMRGKILRLEVLNLPDGPGITPTYQELLPKFGNPFSSDPDPRMRLVWQYGLRNPWSFDIDSRNGTTAIADVGELSYEEVDVTQAAGRNFGWPFWEGPIFKSLFVCSPYDTTRLTEPVYSYPHSSEHNTAIILGGICKREWFVTTGFPDEYLGNVFFADLYDGKLRRLVQGPSGWLIAPPVPGQPEPGAWATGFNFPTRMRFGPDGFLWYAVFGELRRISNPTPVGVPTQPLARASGLHAAWPSPSAGTVHFDYVLAEAARPRLAIVDAAGRRVRRLDDGSLEPAGDHRATWDGKDEQGRPAPPGVYFGVLEVDSARSARRIVRLKAGGG